MVWKDLEMKACQAIFNFDGHHKPAGRSKSFNLVKSMKQSELGLAQRLHPKGHSAIAILKLKKEIKTNVNACIQSLQV
jgi:hypothetical protein